MEPITLKGWKAGLLLGVPESAPWSEALAAIDARLGEADHFWKGASTTIDVGDRALEAEELSLLVSKLKQTYGLVPVGLISKQEKSRELASHAGLEAMDRPSHPERRPAPRAAAPAAPPHNALYLRTTVRSGQRVEHAGHLVICGDVNAGAEVVATGDVVVFGTLRGVAIAGSAGDESARIVATNLRPTQLRIGTKIARSPDQGAPPLSKYPEVALVEAGEIHISPL